MLVIGNHEHTLGNISHKCKCFWSPKQAKACPLESNMAVLLTLLPVFLRVENSTIL